MVADNSTIEICALNVAANPHPPGTYFRLFRRATRFTVKARGVDYAVVSNPRLNDAETSFTGHIHVFTEINLKGKWFDRQKVDELSEEAKAALRVPNHAKPNHRVFDYAFDIRRHLMVFESKNIFGETLGPTVCQRIFEQLFSSDLLGRGYPDVSVSLIPESGTAEALLRTPGIRSLSIDIRLPNADLPTSRRVQGVIAQMEKRQVKRQQIILTKKAGSDGIKPDEDLIETATLAERDGSVEITYRGGSGRIVQKSTNDAPKRVVISGKDKQGFLAQMLTAVRGFLA